VEAEAGATLGDGKALLAVSGELRTASRTGSNAGIGAFEYFDEFWRISQVMVKA